MAISHTQKLWVSPAPLTEDKTHIVEFSEFDGRVFVRFEGSRIVSVEFVSKSGHVTAEDLRKFPMLAVETLILNGGSFGYVPTRPKLERGTSITQEFLEQLTEFYLDALTKNERPLKAIADHLKCPHSTVARWIRTARMLGVLR